MYAFTRGAHHQKVYGSDRPSGLAASDIARDSGRMFLLLVLLLSLLGGSIASVGAAAITFTGSELLGRPTDTSISVSIVPNADISLYYEYGTTTGVYTGQTDATTAAAGQPKVVVISGLTASTKYYYRMQYSTDGGATWVARPEYSFFTRRAAGSTFKFTVTSDSHVNIMLGSATEWTKTMNNVAADHPDFEIDLGDTFAMDGVTTVVGAESAYKYQYQFFNLISASSPIFLAPGNHEQQEGWHLDDTANPALAPPVIGTNAQKKYFLNPVPNSFYSGDTTPFSYLDGDHLREDYYAWRWGDALFVVIDPYWYTMSKPFVGNMGGGEPEAGDGDRWHWTLGLEQFNWLKTTLEGSSARYKFIFAHHMVGGSDDYVRGGANPAHLLEWGGYNEAGTVYEWATKRPGWGSQPIHQMLVANGVSAFFHGHDHQYAYEKRDGVVYQSLPSAGFAGNGFGIYTTGSGYTIQALPSDGHLRVTVTPSQATVDYVQTSGAGVAYTYQIVSVNPTVTISKPSTQPKLDWPVASVDHYAVYRSATAPYFTPSAGTQLADLATGIHTYTDSTADLTVAGSYYYVVASMSAGDAPIGASNRTGAFIFGLTPGSGR